MKSIIFIALALSTFEHPFESDQKWKIFRDTYEKSYINKQEEIFRYKIYKVNDEIIKAHNEKYYKGDELFKMEHNQFSDMDFEELNKIYLHPMIFDQKISFNSITTSISKDPLESLSYKKYCKPPLKQGKCGSCWAFSSTAQVEAQLKIKDPNFNTYISPQYVLDCAEKGSCKGGSPKVALDFMKKNGLVSLNKYPYVSKQHNCNKKIQKMTQNITSSHMTGLNKNEELLKKILSNVGPVVIVTSITRSFFQYKSGIYFDRTCPHDCRAKDINHAMLLVGYGSDNHVRNIDYWLIKNSWGTSWGDSGYVKMIRGSKKFVNNCNIACFAFYSSV